MISAQEHAAKIASARDAIGDADFFLVARTDARATSAKTGLGEAIYRANLYMEVLIMKRKDIVLSQFFHSTLLILPGYLRCK